MSGGNWEYIQYRFIDVAEDIRKQIKMSGKAKTKEELKEEVWLDANWFKKYPEDKFNHAYSKEVLKEFENGAELIEKACVYMQRIDWLLSGDDGEDSFIERLHEELNNLKQKEK